MRDGHRWIGEVSGQQSLVVSHRTAVTAEVVTQVAIRRLGQQVRQAWLLAQQAGKISPSIV